MKKLIVIYLKLFKNDYIKIDKIYQKKEYIFEKYK